MLFVALDQMHHLRHTMGHTISHTILKIGQVSRQIYKVPHLLIFEYSFYYNQEKLFLKHTTRTFRFFKKNSQKMLSVFCVFATLYRQPLTYHKQNKKPDSLQRYIIVYISEWVPGKDGLRYEKFK